MHVSWAANQHFRMISEGSCDTEDWSYDAENQFCIKGINYILIYIQIGNGYLKQKIFHKIAVFTSQINLAFICFVCLKTKQKILLTPNFLKVHINNKKAITIVIHNMEIHK